MRGLSIRRRIEAGVDSFSNFAFLKSHSFTYVSAGFDNSAALTFTLIISKYLFIIRDVSSGLRDLNRFQKELNCQEFEKII